MADREVVLRITADDDTGPGLASAILRAARAQDKLDKQAKKNSDKIGYRLAENLSKAATGVGAALGKIGLDGGKKVADSLSSSLSSAGPQVQGAVVGAITAGIVTGAPLIAATISGVLTAGIASGGVAAGVLLAVRDQRVKSAGIELAERLLGGLSSAASSFIEPTLGAINKINRAFLAGLPQIEEGFRAASAFVTPLTDAILDAGAAIGRGVLAQLQNAGPVISAVSDGIRMLGVAVEYTFTRLAQTGDAGAVALRDLLGLVSSLIIGLADLIATLTEVYGWFRSLGEVGNDSAKGMKEATRGAEGATEGLFAFTAAADASATAATAAAYASRDLSGAFATLEGAQIASARALEAANKVREDGATFTLNEREAILNTANAYNAEIEAMRAQGAASTEVNAKSNSLRESLIAQAMEMGNTRAQAEALVAQYGLFPKNVTTRVGVAGADTAAAELERVRAKAGEIPAIINVAIRVTGSEASRQAIEAAYAKQNMMADASAQFSAAHGFAASGRLMHAEQRAGAARPGPISLNSEVRVNLDGRAIAPVAVAVAREDRKRAAWRSKSKR